VPGTLHLIETEEPRAGGASQRTLPEAHGMNPVQVLALARHLGGEKLPRVLVLGCEPSVRMRGDEPDVVVGLSEPVRAAVDRAVEMLESLTGELLRDPRCDLSSGTTLNSSPTVRS
jgi:Ni,Fe-hydrogenase maturation factor